MTQLPIAPFAAPYAEDDVLIARRLFAAGQPGPDGESRIEARARDLVMAIRAKGGSSLGGVDDMLREYSLSTKEGLALMVLAEALLRVPDSQTADSLIEDKLGQGDFARHEARSQALLVNASAWALGISTRIIQPGETPEGIVGHLAKRLGLPAVRGAVRQAMRVLGSHFVLGQTIEEALERARSGQGRLYRYSFDMLGEGARSARDAERYFASYAAAIDAIGRAAGNRPLPERPGISVKLSALHPRYEAVSEARVMRELVPLLIELARKAKSHDLNFTVDAEEADRLELSLNVIGAAFADPSLAGWDGFGLAIQAYQKRAEAVIRWVGDLAVRLDRRMMVRLVKGAYWDTEVKRAQERGLADYPVFSRKSMTDLNYAHCAGLLLGMRPRIFPQFATHNALTVAAILEHAGAPSGFEFQRLHGMGDVLYARLLETTEGAACRVYAPVGGHRDLLAYLVRRLLENGANSSFVSSAADPEVPIEQIVRSPARIIGGPEQARQRRLPMPVNLHGAMRRNSRGEEFGHRAALEALLGEVERGRGQMPGIAPVAGASITDGTARLPVDLPGIAPVVNGERAEGASRVTVSPIDGRTPVAAVRELAPEATPELFAAAEAGFRAWSRTPATVRADALSRAADLMEERRGLLLHLLALEGGKTLDDGLAEIREAIDFCRYYAAQGAPLFGEGQRLPGPTGETNTLRLRGRGVFVCISPWNFPLAIFMGQVAAALMAGNAVIAKPAEQTPLIAYEAVRLLHQAGVPPSALHLALGDGGIGAALVAQPGVAGVAFTGSTQVGRLIARALAAKDGPIVPLIAETGGINVMIADATALAEQVADDVVMSAFRSAGQRCSALRLLCVQDDVADGMIEMIAGAARELRIGDPRLPETHCGPVIDAEAKARLDGQIARLTREARLHYAGTAPADGTYVAPHLFELKEPRALTEEIFGPVLCVARYKARDLEEVLSAIEASGYGLTLGIHSRITERIESIARRLSVGNIYVNRNMIGAVVGVQPFGGFGLSGTGPKAGGPHYLARFATEQTVTINTAASGGNAELLMGED